MESLLVNIQNTSKDLHYEYDVSNGMFWLDAFQIFQFIVVPILFLAIILFILYKFYKLFKEISASLKQLNDNLKEDK